MEIRFSLGQAAAGVLGVACAALAVLGGVSGSREVCALAVVCAVLACTFAMGCWLSRKFDQLENHVYTEGLRAGFDAKQVVKLPDQRR